ncbi:MAG: chromate transporter [Ruminococcus bicirculans]|nr:chromate transporter [Ruminococcus bicirculans (ex Wegman et al. 2014)]
MKTLFLTFLKIGVFTFGGGYAMIALLETEFCVRKNWLDKKEFLDMTAISESTPGPTAVNSATYIGYKIGGVLGALAATVGVCIPSFFIIYIISLFFDKFLSLKVVYAGFRGIQVGVIYLILTAGLRMLKALDNTLLDKIIMFGVFIMMILFTLFSVKFSSVFYIIISGAVSIAVYLIKTLRKRSTIK